MRFGGILLAGHASVRDNFEISTPEIDQLVMIANEAGATGARMTGGGFGGCIIASLRLDQSEKWDKEIMRRFSRGRVIC
jgi:galactokinase